MEPLYGTREAEAITAVLIEHITGLTRSQVVIDPGRELTSLQQEKFDIAIEKLQAYWPIQYVTGEAWFAGMNFFVDNRVLIPRPETEELVDWITSDLRPGKDVSLTRILDVGTGSGCIAIALKKKLPGIEMWAIDVSEEALEVAKINADRLDAGINFLSLDIRDEESRDSLPDFDYIISNPPYIPELEKSIIPENVLKHEPHLALFVGDYDPLYFYRQISEFAKKHLRKEGSLYFEIHETFSFEIVEFLKEEMHSNVEVRKDLQGKQRMIKAGYG